MRHPAPRTVGPHNDEMLQCSPSPTLAMYGFAAQTS